MDVDDLIICVGMSWKPDYTMETVLYYGNRIRMETYYTIVL